MWFYKTSEGERNSEGSVELWDEPSSVSIPLSEDWHHATTKGKGMVNILCCLSTLLMCYVTMAADPDLWPTNHIHRSGKHYLGCFHGCSMQAG